MSQQHNRRNTWNGWELMRVSKMKWSKDVNIVSNDINITSGRRRSNSDSMISGSIGGVKKRILKDSIKPQQVVNTWNGQNVKRVLLPHPPKSNGSSESKNVVSNRILKVNTLEDLKEQMNPNKTISSISTANPPALTADTFATEIMMTIFQSNVETRTLFIYGVQPSLRDSQLIVIFSRFGILRGMYTQRRDYGLIVVSYCDIRHAILAKNTLANSLPTWKVGFSVPIPFSSLSISRRAGGTNGNTMYEDGCIEIQIEFTGGQVYNPSSSSQQKLISDILESNAVYGEVRSITQNGIAPSNADSSKFKDRASYTVEFFDSRSVVTACEKITSEWRQGLVVHASPKTALSSLVFASDACAKFLNESIADSFASVAPPVPFPAYSQIPQQLYHPQQQQHAILSMPQQLSTVDFYQQQQQRPAEGMMKMQQQFPRQPFYPIASQVLPQQSSLHEQQQPGFFSGNNNKNVASSPVFSPSPNAPVYQPIDLASATPQGTTQNGNAGNNGKGGGNTKGSGRRNYQNNDGSNSSGANNPQMNIIDLDAVMENRDTRTSLMIRNIPNKYTQKMLLDEIDVVCKGSYDFFYLPIDFNNNCNVGYAFINVIDPLMIPKIFKAYNDRRWKRFNSEKVCSINYARIQGKKALVAKFQNSSLMSREEECLPLLFYTEGPKQGQRQEFPDASSPLDE